MDFNNWYKELISDQRWFETMVMTHRGKSVNKAAKEAYAWLISDSVRFNNHDVTDNRKLVHNWLCKAKMESVAPQLQQEEKKEQPEEHNFLTGEARLNWLNKWKETLSGVKIPAPPRMSHKEIMDEGDWLPKKPSNYVLSDHEKQRLILEHQNKIRNARIKYYKEVYPNATDEEIEGFLS